MKVLIADDDLTSRVALTQLLAKWDFQVTAVADGDDAYEKLMAEDAPRLAVLDWLMPGRDGPTLCADLRKSDKGSFFYIILLTAFAQKKDLVFAMEAGADDYVTKPFDPDELRVRLRVGRRILTLQAELLASREAFREQAMHDALTGVLSRRAIFETLERELARAQRNGTGMAVALADIDHFKAIHDRHGHPAGDEVLREVSRRMLSSLRTSDVVGRVGGEEFLVVLPEADANSAARVAERIRSALSAEPIATAAGSLPVTASFGVAATPAPPCGVDALVSAADRALYVAKNSGRDRVAQLAPDAGT